MRMLLGVALCVTPALVAQRLPSDVHQSAIDRDLMDVSVDRLHALYREHRYSVTQVVQWHLDRIWRYNGFYQAVQTVSAKTALAEAAREDAEAKQPGFTPGLLWGVPVVTKANSSIKGLTTTAGGAATCCRVIRRSRPGTPPLSRSYVQQVRSCWG